MNAKSRINLQELRHSEWHLAVRFTTTVFPRSQDGEYSRPNNQDPSCKTYFKFLTGIVLEGN